MPTGQRVDSPGAGRRTAAPRQGDADAAGAPVGERRRRSGRARAARRAVQHHARRGRGARRRLRGRHQERRLLRGLRRLLHRPGAAGDVAGEPVATVHTAVAEVGPGRRHRAGPDRPHRTRRLPGDHRTGRHPGRLGRLHLGVPADVHDRRRGPQHLPGGAREGPRDGQAAVRHPPPGVGARRTAAGGRQGGHRLRGGAGGPGRRARRGGRRPGTGVPAPPHPAVRPAHRAGLRARAVLVRRAPRGGRGGHRTRPGQGRRTGLRAGRRQGAQPAVGGRTDPGRQHAGAGPGGHGGDPGRTGRRGSATRPSPTTSSRPSWTPRPSRSTSWSSPTSTRPTGCAASARRPRCHRRPPSSPPSVRRPAATCAACRCARSTSPGPDRWPVTTGHPPARRPAGRRTIPGRDGRGRGRPRGA